MFVSDDMNMSTSRTFLVLSEHLMYVYPSVRVGMLLQGSVLLDPCSLHICVQRVYQYWATVSLTLD
jgi:hypothetical protein